MLDLDTTPDPNLADVRHDEIATNGNRVVMRRAGFGLAGIAAAGLFTAKSASAATPNPTSDAAIFNFALNFEYLGAEYYLRAVTGQGVSAFTGVTGVGTQGTVVGGSLVPFQTTAIAYYAQQLANDELAHVKFIRAALGSAAIAEPAIDIAAAWSVLAAAAGLAPAGGSFDPYANEVNFLLGAYVLEDVCVSALAGAASLLTVPDNISYAASMLAAEGYQAGAIRAYLSDIGGGAATNAISALRATLGGTFDNGTSADSNAYNFTNVDYNGMVARRTTSQVLSIAYGSNTAGTSSGLFFPAGVNGSITTV